jgi:hypothetical protein
MKKTMKKFAAICCAVMVLAFTGCSKNLEEEIIGSWRMQSITQTEDFHGQSHSETVIFDEDEIVIFTFNEDNSFSQESINGEQTFTRSGTYSISGDKLTFIIPDEEEPFTSVVKIDGSDMTLTYSEIHGEETVNVVASLKKI